MVPALLLLVGAVLLGLVGMSAWRSGSPARAKIEVAGSPKLKPDRQSIDLGEVRLGRTVEVAFELANVGDQPLRFTDPPYVEVVEGC